MLSAHITLGCTSLGCEQKPKQTEGSPFSPGLVVMMTLTHHVVGPCCYVFTIVIQFDQQIYLMGALRLEEILCLCIVSHANATTMGLVAMRYDGGGGNFLLCCVSVPPPPAGRLSTGAPAFYKLDLI